MESLFSFVQENWGWMLFILVIVVFYGLGSNSNPTGPNKNE